MTGQRSTGAAFGVEVGTTIGGFRLMDSLGEGGMGAVFRAQNVRVERMVRALKVIRPQLAADPDFRARFLREAEFLELLQHPNILRVENIGEEQGALFMVMELLSGETIDRLVARNQGGVAVADAASLLAQALAGIGHAHVNGVIHRDLKPANLFLTAQGAVKVLDFGIARHGDTQSKLTHTGQAIPGSPAYYAPEFVTGQPASPQSDLYALGITLFELLAGQLPYRGGGGNETQAALSLMVQHATQPLPDIRQVRPDIPPDMLRVLALSTAKDPSQRYPDAASFANDLLVAAGVSGVRPVPSPARSSGSFPGFSPPPMATPAPAGGLQPMRTPPQATPAPAPFTPLPLSPRVASSPGFAGLSPGPGSPPPSSTPAPMPGVSTSFLAPSMTPAPTPAPGGAPRAMPRTSSSEGLTPVGTHFGLPSMTPAPSRSFTPAPVEEPPPKHKGLSTGMMLGVGGLSLVIAVGGGIWFAATHGKGAHPEKKPDVAEAAKPVEAPKPAEPPKPKVVAPQGMVLIEGATLKMGRAPYGDAAALDTPEHPVEVASFAIEKTEVTIDAYRAFSDAAHVKPPWPPMLKDFSVLGKLPVANVSHGDAEAYCQWKFRQGRLPTEAEWELAARGPEGRLYPWGNEFRAVCANGMQGDSGTLQRSDEHQCGATPQGLLDLSGNVWEWTSSHPQAYPGSTARLPPEGAPFFVARGGSFANQSPNELTASARTFLAGPNRYTGFRCASAPQEL